MAAEEVGAGPICAKPDSAASQTNDRTTPQTLDLFMRSLSFRPPLRKIGGRGRTLPVLARVRTVAERALLAHAAAAKADRGLAGEVPFLAVGVLQNDVAFHPQRAVGTNCNMNRFLFHAKPPRYEARIAA